MPRCLVINEWLLHDLGGVNGPNKQRESILFIDKFLSNNDRIAVLKGTSWTKKAYDLMKHKNSSIVLFSKKLHVGILANSTKSLLIDALDKEVLSPDFKRELPPEDVYLVETYVISDANTLVTTDEKLKKIIDQKTQGKINVVLRSKFLSNY